MDYYSGQGQLSAAKRNADGSIGPKFRLGNVPKCEINISLKTIIIAIEQLSSETLEIIAGSIVSVEDNTLNIELGDGAPFEYEVFFNGVNTAANNRAMIGHFFRVKFESSFEWELIGNDIAGAKVHGYLMPDETRGGKVGTLSYRHKESETGLRLTDMQVEAASI